jgi:FkbM family methyltransferase
VDIGANVGATAVFFRAAYPGARICCYEPSPGNFEYLRANTSALRDVEIFPYGLADRETSCALYEGQSQSAQRSVVRTISTLERFETIRLRRASEELTERGIAEISLLKIDTEGCEVPILEDLLAGTPVIDVIQVEYHSEDDRRAIDAMLADRFLLLHARVDELHRGTCTYLSREVVRQHPELETFRIPRASFAPAEGPTTTVALAFETSSGPASVDLRLDPTTYSQRIMATAFAAGEFYEPEVSYFLTAVLQPGDHFVDVGAHIGYFSLVASRAVGESGLVVAFEPEAGNYQRILGHLADNAMHNVRVFNHAIGAEAGQGTFFFNSDNDGGHAFWDVSKHALCERTRLEHRTLSVPVDTLDAALARVPSGAPLRVIKIDAEGCEYDVLKGGLKTLLAREVPYVVCEINRFALEQMGSSEVALRALMGMVGYRTYLLKPDASGVVELLPGQNYVSPHVFNVLFSREQLG